MKNRVALYEFALLLVVLALLLLALLGPALAPPPDYHQFADQRSWLGMPHAWDVLSNLPFALWGLAGLAVLMRLPQSTAQASPTAQRWLATLFFGGLVLTAAASSYYHWQPDEPGLALDRLGMVLAFAGLLGLAVADRVSDRAGGALAAAVLVFGPLSIAAVLQQDNFLPWVVLQAGSLLLLVALASLPPLRGVLGLRLGTVIALYALAKALELGDHAVFAFSDGFVSGHSLKHVVASLAAWPVLAAVLKC